MPYKDPEQARMRARARYAETRETVLAQKQVYVARNRATITAKARARYAKHRTQRLAQKRVYIAAHHGDILTKKRAHYAANRDALLVRKRRSDARHRTEKVLRDRHYNATHRAQRNALAAVYRLQHRLRLRLQARQWRKAHPLRAHMYAVAYRARKHQAPINDFTPAQWIEMQAAYDYRCVYCGRKVQRLTQDHITPFIKQGSHTASNIVPACPQCNSRKKAGPPLCSVQPLLLTLAPSRKRRA